MKEEREEAAPNMRLIPGHVKRFSVLFRGTRWNSLVRVWCVGGEAAEMVWGVAGSVRVCERSRARVGRYSGERRRMEFDRNGTGGVVEE